MEDSTAARPYVLGHSDHELDRLMTQARLIDPLTTRFFREAGIAAGMRVLDVGSGAGDVAFIAAGLVGDTGEVVGVDRVAAALDVAKTRVAAQSWRNVAFRAGDPAEIAFDRPFDAIVGRYVLQFQRDPAAMLRKLVTYLKPGGIVVFHEIDWGGLASFPPVPTYDQCCRWGMETLRRHGTETRMGARLYATFVAAGLTPPTMRLESLLGGAADSLNRVRLLADLLATLLPEMERLGVATREQLGLETLVERIREEALASSSILVGHAQIAAWSRV